MSKRNYVTIATGQQIHYRESGEGQAVILLHPSPLSSGFMEPLITLFARQARAIAWDTPGYGQSDPLAEPTDDLTGYVQALYDFMKAMGLEKAIIYGSATGAQIAIEFAKAHPSMALGLLVENAAWFYDDEREVIMENYFPDLSAQADGAHLNKVWEISNNLYRYFPWYDTRDEAIVNSHGAPLDIVHRTAIEYLIAGTDYSRAYKAAFMNERPEQLQLVTVPTRVFRWSSSILKKYIDRLDNVEMPDNIIMSYANEGIEARFEGLAATLADLM